MQREEKTIRVVRRTGKEKMTTTSQIARCTKHRMTLTERLMRMMDRIALRLRKIYSELFVKDYVPLGRVRG